MTGDVRIKRIYDPPAREDGRRILITRYWPRGVPKSAVDEYVPALAPSRELVRAFKHGGLSWEEFSRRFLEEMRSEEAERALSRLAGLARETTVTLLCTCADESRCHRSLVRDLVFAAGSAPQAGGRGSTGKRR
jgi:uncharacterized protein YeaO (DUF488 family)